MADKTIKDFDAVITPAATDILLTQQAADDVNRKMTVTQTVQAVDPKAHTHVEAEVTDLTHTDETAIHDNVAAEISAITEKVTPVAADLVMIEDSEASNAKKKAQVVNLFAVILAGEIKLWATGTAPTGWLLLDGTERNASSFTTLFDVFVSDLTVWGLGTKTGDVTTDFATDDKIDLTAHGLDNGEVVHFSTTGTLPAGLSLNTKYFVINKTANDFEVSLTSGGAAVDITDDGSGTHSVHETFALPDMRGRTPIGVGTGAGLTARALADTGGAETHQLTEAELAAHLHDIGTLKLFTGSITTEVAYGSLSPGATKNTSSTGSDTAHENMSPFIALNYIIKT